MTKEGDVVEEPTVMMVKDLEWTKDDSRTRSIVQGWRKPGPVKVRPCGEKYGDKTYLGIYIGDAALSVSTRHREDDQVLELGFSHYNPAIFIPELGEIVFGIESWLGPISSIEEIESITDEDINQVWYVQAIKAMIEGQEKDDD